jgi:hypothetical protein
MIDGVNRMTMVDADPVLPSRPQSLRGFLAAWLATYLAPLLLTWAAVFVAVVSRLVGTPDTARHVSSILWLSMFPVGLAFSQWLLMRRCVPDARPWGIATFVAALLAQLSHLFVPVVTVDTVRAFPQLMWVTDLIISIFGLSIGFDVLAVLLIALCVGAAWSIPQALVLPGSRLARGVWSVALLLTGFLTVVMVTALSGELLRAVVFRPSAYWNWIPMAASHLLPTILGWLVLALIGGLIMHWTLRRSSSAGNSQVYARFD